MMPNLLSRSIVDTLVDKTKVTQIFFAFFKQVLSEDTVTGDKCLPLESEVGFDLEDCNVFLSNMERAWRWFCPGVTSN